MNLPKDLIEEAVRRALEEDLGDIGDVTTRATIPPDRPAKAIIEARQDGVLAGLPLAAEVFRQVDPSILLSCLAQDGNEVKAGQSLVAIKGPSAGILTAERTALNFLGHLSGIATETRKFVNAVEGTGTKILDTRKTTPGLRLLEKYAVKMGGGENHRIGLFDAILIKDNHIAAAGGISAAIRAAKTKGMPIEVEVDSLDQLEEAIECGLDRVLLDNMDVQTLRSAVLIAGARVQTEASGGVTLSNARAIAETGVDFISVGWITHSAPNFDVALEFDRGH